MPPSRSIRPLAGLRLKPQRHILNPRSPCLLCSTARSSGLATPLPSPLARRATRAAYSTAATLTEPAPATPSSPPIDPRTELEQALLELNSHAANYVNLSRLQLALLGLRQPAGEETIRVAVLGVNGAQGGAGDTAREVLRLMLADPLREEEEWERQLAGAAGRGAAPVLVRVDGRERSAEGGIIERRGMFDEVRVSSPGFRGGNLEVLLMDVNPPAGGQGEAALLDLPVDIVSGIDRVSPIMTPVHKTVLVAEGLVGVPSVSGLPPNEEHGVIFSAVDLPGYQPPTTDAPATPFLPIDVSKASKGVGLFRESLSHGMDYERLWFQSRVPALSAWLKYGTASQPGTTKPAVRALISSVLQNTLVALEGSKAATAAPSPSPAAGSSGPVLRRGLADWAQGAHAELQDQLDLAFTGQKWRKLNWWKLFWRVDDVGMLTSDILANSFLPTAEKNLVFLAGRVSAASPNELTYNQPGTSAVSRSEGGGRWPTHVSFTRRYLQEETIPALQALAQKLVLQAASTSGLTASLAALLYVSQWASSFYEAGAVAALGAVWSLWRMQGKWEAARGFWEGEVREEGRKAVRGAERSLVQALERDSVVQRDDGEERRVRELVERARDALARMK
ncbi:uncharacterized protein DNG_03483 [Cephalotrichum gorgonifer]|uniref:Mmc1 C-terminal domain-containing protein n=1 Tax=Cephalotrichum gorgonifer TaxID=2041049 RepID=A0AAE8SUB4_9PEZI|nr:uncharacterized protein DNG_03483 [Cephalotrichum gorgonifer]